MQKRQVSLEEDSAHLNNIWGALTSFFKWGAIVITVFFIYKIVVVVAAASVKQAELFAGKEALANIKTTSSYQLNGDVNGNFLSNLVNLNIDSGYHWLIHIISVGVIIMLYFAYTIQKRTNEKFIETYSPQEIAYEKQYDPHRTSRGLTRQGNTPK